MEISSEYKSSFDKLLAEREAEGWSYIGMDQLRETKFQDGLFIEVPVRTEQEIIERQKQILVRKRGSEEDIEVELVARPGQKIRDLEIPDKFGMYFVFARMKKK